MWKISPLLPGFQIDINIYIYVYTVIQKYTKYIYILYIQTGDRRRISEASRQYFHISPTTCYDSTVATPNN